MKIEDERLDVLQNLEAAVARLYRIHPDMTDHAVLRTYEALQREYAAKVTGRWQQPAAAEGVEADLLADVKAVCEWRLGRAPRPWDSGATPECEPLDVPTLVRCLKRLVKSVSKWTKRCGRRGYLDFMTQFVR